MEREMPPYLRRYRERRRPPAPPTAPAADGNGAGTRAALRTLSEDQLSAPPIPMSSGLVDLHLVRHGETQSYAGDAGLTARGEWQARQVGLALAREVREGERVRFLAAPTARAGATAAHVRQGIEEGLAACGRTAVVLGVDVSAAFGNFRVWTPDGPADPTTAVGRYLAAARVRGAEPEPLWQLEVGRFHRLQRGGADPISYWLTMPLLAFESPAQVVRRFWEAAMRLVGEDGDDGADGGTRFVCCTHSGPIRAVAAWALGHDAGEPYNGEQVRVRIRPEGGRALVTYRTRTQEVASPPVAGPWGPAGASSPGEEAEP